MPTNIADNLRLLFKEAMLYHRLIVAAFIAVTLIAVVAGINWPKSYATSTTVVIEEDNILGSLMAGAAVQTGIDDRANIAREVIYGRNIMNQVLEIAGWTQVVSGPAEKEQVIEDIKARTLITNVGTNLIRIEYRDADPERAMTTARGFAELFVSESLAAKSRESEAAYKFIDDQVTVYQSRLKQLDERLKEFRMANADARPEADSEVRRRLAELNSRLSDLDQTLREAEIRRASLQKQLSGEAETASILSRAEQFRGRIGEMENQLATLRLSYHDSYPDITRLREQIEDLKQAVIAEEQRGRAVRQKAPDGESRQVDSALLASPLYQELRGEIYQTSITIETIQSRIAETQRLIQRERERSGDIQNADAQLTELNRDYEVTQELYQDLLRRREAARVSMNLDKEQQGLRIRIDEAAFLPQRASGPRLLHFMVGGMIFGLAAPLGLLFGIRTVDPRVRHEFVVVERLGVETAGTIPCLMTPKEVRRDAASLVIDAIAVVVTVAVLAVVALLRMEGSL